MSAILAMMLLSFVFTNTVTTTILAEMRLSVMLTVTSDSVLRYASLAIHVLLLIYNMHYPFYITIHLEKILYVKSDLNTFYIIHRTDDCRFRPHN